MKIIKLSQQEKDINDYMEGISSPTDIEIILYDPSLEDYIPVKVWAYFNYYGVDDGEGLDVDYMTLVDDLTIDGKFFPENSSIHELEDYYENIDDLRKEAEEEVAEKIRKIHSVHN